jgi:hypothetical protein
LINLKKYLLQFSEILLKFPKKLTITRENKRFEQKYCKQPDQKSFFDPKIAQKIDRIKIKQHCMRILSN